MTRRSDVVGSLNDPYFFPLDFELGEGWSVFVQTGWDEFCARLRISALDFPLERLCVVPNDQIVAAGRSLQGGCNLNFLFHMPFSGSSFVTRLLEVPDILPVRDPACIDALFQAASNHVQCAEMSELRECLLRLLNRPVPGRAMLIRTAGYHPQMFAPLAGVPECRSTLFLFEGLRTFVLQILKSERRRRDLQMLLRRNVQLVEQRTGRPLDGLCDSEIATVFWVCSAEAFLALRHPRARSVDSTDLFERPEQTAELVAQFIGADLPRPLRRASVAVQVHAKTGEPFDPARRSAGITALRLHYGADLSRSEHLAASLGAWALECDLRQRALQ